MSVRYFQRSLLLAGRHCLRRQALHSSRPVVLRNFTTAAAASKVTKVLDAELKHEKEQYEQSNEIQKFLKQGSFTFEETDGDVNMALVREMGGKTVRIEWQLSSPFDPSMDVEGEEGGEAPESTEFSVTIENPKTGAGLTFYCSTQAGDDHRYVIGNVTSFASKELKDSVSAYNGPEFEDLDEKVQEALDECLAEMGMNDEVCNFIDASARDKEQREYMGWLSGMKKLLE